jgi:signal transduction histidine kinase
MESMTIKFLWDEEKTRHLYRTTLIVITAGAVVGQIFTLLLPANLRYHSVILIIPAIFIATLVPHWLLLSKPHPGVRLWLLLLGTQIMTTIFMALTGGLLGIVQFAPFLLVIFCVVELGIGPTILLGISSLITFVFVVIYTYFNFPQPSLLANSFYYIASYLSVMVLSRTIGQEISIQYEARKKLEEVDDLKNQFITLASHYFRTPITKIKYAFIELEKTSLNDTQLTLVQPLNGSVSELEGIIEKLLAISYIQKGSIKISKIPANVYSLIGVVVQDLTPVAKDQQITITYQPPTEPYEAEIDPSLIKNVLSNLVTNAIIYNKPGGSVAIQCQAMDDHLTISVSDTGQGIPADQLDTLFTSFNRGSLAKALESDKPGTGLGLYLAKLITDAHQGTISVASEVGKGSTFTLVLPKTKTLPTTSEHNLAQTEGQPD